MAREHIDRFGILGEIGKGGMGTVYKAQDPRMNRVVAIKLINERFDNAKNRDRFQQEARAAGGLSSPHIVTVFEFGDYKGKPYIVMEFLVGTPLDRLIEQRANMALDSKLRLMEGLCSGLASAHSKSIIHRDIKPANLMVCAGNVLKILDFGIARVGARVGESAMTMTGQVVGTFNYMSPEQFRGETELDARSDIFAVGAVFYELLAYQRAFPGGQWEVFPKILNGNPTPIATLCAGLDPEIPEIISKALQKKPDDRYQSVTEMGREISRIRNRLERLRAQVEVDAARRLWEQGKAEEAIPYLERFTPSIDLVDDALAELRQAAREKQRKTAIAGKLLSAHEAFDRSDFEAAIRAADELLHLDSSNEVAHALREQAQHALDEKLRQERERQERDAEAKRVVEQARRLFDAGSHDEALEQLWNAPAHPLTQRTIETLEAKYTDIKRERERQERDAEAKRIVERARRLFDAGRHDEALAQLTNAPAHPLTQRTIAALEAKYKEITRERQARDADARRIVEQAQRLFEAGRHGEALALLSNAPAHPLTQSTLETLEAQYNDIKRDRERQERDAAAKRIVERARRLFEAGRHDEALGQLKNTPAHPLTQSTLETFEAKYKEIIRERQEREAEAARTVEQARRLFEAGRHDEALAQLRNAPAHALTQSTFKDLEAKYNDIKRQRDAEATRTVEQARRLFDSGRHEEALAQLRNAPTHALTQSTFEDLEAKYKAITRERDAEATRTDEQARQLFEAGRHDEALERLRKAPAHPLTQRTLENLEAKYTDIRRERDVEANRIVQQARQLFDEGRHDEALERLRNVPTHTLTQSALEELEANHKEIVRKREQQARDAEAKRIVEQARQLFDAGRHDEALERLRSTPTHALTRSALEELTAKYEDITQQERDAEAKQIVDRARQLFDAGSHGEALAQLRNAPAHMLTQSTLQTLTTKYEDITREREQQEREAKRTVEQAQRLFDEGRHDEALAELRNVPVHPLTQRAIETLEAKYKEITRERQERDGEARRTVEQAQRLCEAGRHDEALTELRSAPAHPLTQRAIENLEAKYTEITRERDAEATRIVEHARRLFDSGRHDDALAQLRKQLRNAPAHTLTQRTLQILEAKYEDIKREREVRTRAEFQRYRGGEIVPSLDVSTARPVDDNVRFTMYRPAGMAPRQWYPLLVFTHVGERRPDAPPDEPDPLAQVETIARSVLGSAASSFPRIVEDAGTGIPHQALLRIAPSVRGLTFNPPEYSFLWIDSVHKAEFKIQASASLEGQTARGSMDVWMGAILVAQITVAIPIGARHHEEKPPILEVFQPYRRIFASYSHKDWAIVRQFETYARGMGDSYMRDVIDLRAGEIWSDRLMALIDGADVFQLFWSTNSMESPFVRCEWEHALTVNKSQFVRPLYWETPFPEREGLPPPELKALHFASVAIAKASDVDASTRARERRHHAEAEMTRQIEQERDRAEEEKRRFEEDIKRERERQERDAEATRIVEQARQLFDAGHHEEALEQLRNAPVHALTQTTFQNLEAKYQDIKRERVQGRRRRRQARRAAAVAALRRTLSDRRVHLTGAMLVTVVLAWNTRQFWPTSTSPPPVVNTHPPSDGATKSDPPVASEPPKTIPSPETVSPPVEPPDKKPVREPSAPAKTPPPIDPKSKPTPPPDSDPKPVPPDREREPEPEPRNPSPPPPALDLGPQRIAIGRLVDNYRTSCEREPAKCLNQIDPTFGEIQRRDVLKGLQVQVSDLNITIAPDAQSAAVTFTQNFNYVWSLPNLPRNGNGTVTWTLANSGGGWTVTKATSGLRGLAEIETELNRNDIEDTLERFREAFNRQDMKSINQLYPGATREYLYGRDCSKVDLTFKSKSRADLLGKARAQVDTRAVRTCTPAIKKKVSPVESTNTFRLEKKEKEGWIIVDLQVSVAGK